MILEFNYLVCHLRNEYFTKKVFIFIDSRNFFAHHINFTLSMRVDFLILGSNLLFLKSYQLK